MLTPCTIQLRIAHLIQLQRCRSQILFHVYFLMINYEYLEITHASLSNSKFRKGKWHLHELFPLKCKVRFACWYSIFRVLYWFSGWNPTSILANVEHVLNVIFAWFRIKWKNSREKINLGSIFISVVIVLPKGSCISICFSVNCLLSKPLRI